MFGRRSTSLKKDLERVFKLVVEERHLEKLSESTLATLRYILDLTEKNPRLVTEHDKKRISDILAKVESDVAAAEQLISTLSHGLQARLKAERGTNF